MQIDMYPTYDAVAEHELRGAAVLVIDVLRATSVITTALHNGCREVIPAAELDEAMDLYRRMGEGTLLGGERHAVKLEGFDFSNSPLEYTEAQVSGRTLVMTTTNGTRAIRRAKEGSAVLLGCMLNARAAAQTLLCLGQERVVILCAGTGGRYSIDDCLCGGAIIRAMLDLAGTQPIEMDDLAIASLEMYDRHRNDLLGALSRCHHYQKLVSVGYEEDVHFCMQESVMDVVPVFSDGVLRAMRV